MKLRKHVHVFDVNLYTLSMIAVYAHDINVNLFDVLSTEC